MNPCSSHPIRYLVAMTVLCGALATASADASTPPQAPGETGFVQGLRGAQQPLHLEKRGLLKPLTKWLYGKALHLFNGRYYYSYNGFWYSEHAVERIVKDKRMSFITADYIARNGTVLVDTRPNKKEYVIRYIRNLGHVLLDESDPKNKIIVSVEHSNSGKRKIQSGTYKSPFPMSRF